MIDRFFAILMTLVVCVTFVSSISNCSSITPQRTKFVNSSLWHVQAHEWGNLPVKVKVHDFPLKKHLEETTQNGIDFWNKTIGCTVLRMAKEDEVAEIDVFMSTHTKQSMKLKWVASAKMVTKSYQVWEGLSSRIDVYNLFMDKTLQSNIMAHELGHSLGLNDLYDKEDQPNIMYGRSGMGTGVDERAVRLLRRMYCYGR